VRAGEGLLRPVASDPAPELQDPQQPGEQGEEESGDRGDHQGDRHRDLTVPGQERHLGLTGVLRDEDDEQEQYDAQAHRRGPEAAGPRPSERIAVLPVELVMQQAFTLGLGSVCHGR